MLNDLSQIESLLSNLEDSLTLAGDLTASPSETSSQPVEDKERQMKIVQEISHAFQYLKGNYVNEINSPGTSQVQVESCFFYFFSQFISLSLF